MSLYVEWEPEEPIAEVARALDAALAVVGVDLRAQVFVRSVGEQEMRDINRRTRGIDRVTDVLSFPSMRLRTPGVIPPRKAEIDPDTGCVPLGDLILCVPRAREQAEAYGHTLTRELSYLSAHGMLHLLGYDHESDEDRAVMRDLEERAMARAGTPR